jgi:hypothetical protein
MFSTDFGAAETMTAGNNIAPTATLTASEVAVAGEDLLYLGGYITAGNPTASPLDVTITLSYGTASTIVYRGVAYTGQTQLWRIDPPHRGYLVTPGGSTLSLAITNNDGVATLNIARITGFFTRRKVVSYS